MSIIFCLIMLVVSFVLSEILRPKPEFEDAKPAGLGDFRFATATQARVVPLLWGTCMIAGPNVTWWGDLQQVPITEKVKTGMFSSKRITVGYKYYLGFMLGLCRGPIDSVRKVWIKKKLVYNGGTLGVININRPNLFGGDDLGYGGVIGNLRVQSGSSTQAANNYLVSKGLTVGGQGHRFLGTAYLAWEKGYLGNATSIDPWEFEVRRIPNGLGLGTPSVNSGNDANPMNVIYEIMTNIEWGLGIPAADINTTEFSTAAATLESEGNGYSRLLDRQMEAKDLLREIEQQIDGIIFLDHQTGKYRVTLIRDDYDIDLVPQLDETNIVSIGDFSRGGWRETTNQVKIQFNNRSNRYADDFALAQDMANAMMQGGGTVQTGISVSTTVNYPGVKNKGLANAIAWRDIRPLSYPLARVNLTVDKSFWDLTPGSVVAWSDDDLGFTKLPMRVLRIDHGQLDDNRMVLKCVQDVFSFGPGLYEDPPDTNWDPPEDDLDPFPVDEQIAMEAPRWFCYQDPERVGDMVDKIWCSGRAQGNEVGFKILERHATAPTTPAGAFTEVGESYGLMLIGKLKNDLESGTAVPTTSILIEADPDAQAILEAAFEDDPAIEDQGINLQNLIMIGNEFMVPRSAAISGADVDLEDVYRGVLDGGQEAHDADDDVYLIFVGGNLMTSTIPDGENVHVKLLPFSATDEVAEGDATQIAFEMDDRLIRPYPPASMDLNGTKFNQGTVSLDYLASGAAETTGMDLDFDRRDFRTAEGGDEIAALLVDAATIFSDFPSNNSTDHDAEVWDDPDGTPTLLFTEANISGTNQALLRIKILKETDGAIPSRMRVVLKARHDAGGKTGLLSRNNLTFDFDTGSAALAGQFNFTALDTNDVSAEYTADAAGQHDFTLSSSFTVGNVEYRIDTGGGYGSWTTLITAGGTTGNIAGVAIGDKIEIRHLSTDTNALKQIDMTAPGAGTDAYGILFT